MTKTNIIVVAGPPAAGKTTYVENQKDISDVVIDLDRLAIALGSDKATGHPETIQQFAEIIRDYAVMIATGHGYLKARRVWITTEAPTMAERYALAAMAVIVLETPAAEAIIRAKNAGRHGDYEDRVKTWWKQYEPCSTDILLNPYENKAN